MRRAAKIGVYLGVLCKRGHDHEGSGGSLRHAAGHCIECVRLSRQIRASEYPEKAARQAARAKERQAIRRPRKGRQLLTVEEKMRRAREARRAKNAVEGAYSAEYYTRNHLRIRIRNRVAKAIRAECPSRYKGLSAYGIDVVAIIAHLGPCPGVRSAWHIDHIRPLASFDLSDPEQVKAAFAPQNHQWLTARENQRKHTKHGS